MKKLIYLLLSLATLFTLSSCAKDSPENVAKKFILALNEYNYEEADKYASNSAKKAILFVKKMQNFGASLRKKQNEKTYLFAKDLDLKIIDSQINEDEAVVTYSYLKNGKEKIDTLDLVYQEDKWLVVIKK